MNAHPPNAQYMLCVRWPPSLNRPQLSSLVHGLWVPGERVDDITLTLTEVQQLPKALMVQLRRFMPSLIGEDLWINHLSLWNNEWKRHGKDMDMTIDRYFLLTLELFSKIPQPDQMGIEPGGRRFSVAEFIERSKAAVSPDAVPQVVGYLDKRQSSSKRKLEVYDIRYYFDEYYNFVPASQTFAGDIDNVNEFIGLPKKPFLLKDSN